MALQLQLCGTGLSYIEGVINGQRNTTRKQMQEADVFQTISVSVLAADSQRAQPPVCSGQGQADYRSDVDALGFQLLLQGRETGVRAPVLNVQGRLRVINVPAHRLLDRQFGAGNLELRGNAPLDVAGILFEDKNIEIVETDEFTQPVGENL